ncbi:MAG: anthranilate phosphoribosyltransferase, partial [Candidatus Omnitrophota bacterium]|nr:anthranilate phosphoribosyltransferase [Candidatus Omnitrophota bacterium]
AQVLKNLGSKKAIVVCGMDKLDEITIACETKVTELKDGNIKTYYVTPEEFGIKRSSLEEIKGGTAKENAEITLSVLRGESGARKDIVLLNSAAALVVASKAKDFREGIKEAVSSIDSGRAIEKLKQLIGFTNRT